MIYKGIFRLSARLDDIINFAQSDDRKFPTKTAVGAAGVGAAGYGLYKRGQALGPVAGPDPRTRIHQRMVFTDYPPKFGARVRNVGKPIGKRGIYKKEFYTTAKSRGITGNILAGAEALPGDIARGARWTTGAAILSIGGAAAFPHSSPTSNLSGFQRARLRLANRLSASAGAFLKPIRK